MLRPTNYQIFDFSNFVDAANDMGHTHRKYRLEKH